MSTPKAITSDPDTKFTTLSLALSRKVFSTIRNIAVPLMVASAVLILTACGSQLPVWLEPDSRDIAQRSKEVSALEREPQLPVVPDQPPIPRLSGIRGVNDSDSTAVSVSRRETGVVVPDVGIADSRGPWDPVFDERLPLPGHEAPVLEVFRVSISSSSEPAVVSVDTAGQVLLWPLRGSQYAFELTHLREEVKAVALSDDLRLLAVVPPSPGRLVKIYSLPDKAWFEQFDRLPTRVSTMEFQPGAHSLVVGGFDGRIYRWRFREGEDQALLEDRNKKYERYIGHSSVIKTIGYHPYGRVFFSGDWAGALSAWLSYDIDPYKGRYDENIFIGKFFTDRSRRAKARRPNSDSVEKIEVSRDGKFLYLAIENGEVEIWDVRGFRRLTSEEAHRGLIYHMAVSPNGRWVATYGRDSFLNVWELVEELDEYEGELEHELKQRHQVSIVGVSALEFFTDRAVVAGNRNGKMIYVDLNSLPLFEEDVSD